MSTETENKPRPRKERKENADKRRRQLLEATLRSVVVNGLSKTTLSTVAAEAGLSQGVVAFYFKNKGGLLTEALRAQYKKYEDNWSAHLDAAQSDPASQLIALIKADFAPDICNQDALAVWFSFWGEQKFTPQYAEIAQDFDLRRGNKIREICQGLLPDSDERRIDLVAEWFDTLTDGYWQKLHLFPQELTPKQAVEDTLALVQEVLPQIADQFRNA